MKQNQVKSSMPNVQLLERELTRRKNRKRYFAVLKSTVYALIVVAAISVLVATLWMPVLRIYGNSMNPTLTDGEIIVSVKSEKFETTDLIAFYANNKLLIKRVIAGPGDWVSIDDDGQVYVNEQPLQEDYVSELDLGNCDIKLPYQVPDSCWFVMGDHRSTSIDSRNKNIGCIYEEQIVGRVVFRVWPLPSFGAVK